MAAASAARSLIEVRLLDRAAPPGPCRADTPPGLHPVPVMKELSFSWLPPVRKMALTLPSGSTRSGSCACVRLSGRSEMTSLAPSDVKTPL
jgi:hypothetical protein